MRYRPLSLFCAALWFMAGVQPLWAEKLVLNYLPPDFPPSDVCSATPLELEPEELLEGDPDPAQQVTLDNAERIQFLKRDIRDLTLQGADRWFDFIMELINWQAELDPGFTGIDEAFARVDLFLAAARLEELRERALIDGITLRVDELTNSQLVRLARFYLAGIGVDVDRDRAERLLIRAAFAGNADALLELLRLQTAGETVTGWDLPLEETAKLAFGGMIGQLNKGLCNRAERMAREYVDGDILAPNPDLAYAWRKFAADMGGAEAAWRVVEHHLSATASVKDDEELLHYLQLAVANAYVFEPDDVTELLESGAKTEVEIRKHLGFNYGRVGSVRRHTAVPFLELDVNPVSEIQAEDSEYLRYLREVAARPDAPSLILIRLAKEILLRQGRWAGEVEAIEVLERAVRLDDPEAMAMLAEMLLGQVEDVARTNRAQELLIDAVSRHGYGVAMNALADVYRCRLPKSPMLEEAEFWAASYRAADLATVTVSPTDLVKIDASKEPEAITKLQSLALLGHGGSTADMLQLLQSDPLATDLALRAWAGRVSGNDQALEEYAKQEFELALTSDEGDSAIELFRRVYLDTGATSALDLAIVLVKHSGRDPGVAEEIRKLLNIAGRRGEGAAIRLLQRLTEKDGVEIYRDFASAIDARGDFLALMFAAPYVDDETFDKYMSRAVAVMNCNSKDVAELADANTIRNRPDAAHHWMLVGLAMEGGHTLSKLGLSDWQMADYDRGEPASIDQAEERALAENDGDALRQQYLLTADASAPTFDAEAAAEQLATLIGGDDIPAMNWGFARYRQADRRVQRALEQRLDIDAVLENAAAAGNGSAQYELGMLLRRRAGGIEDLKASAEWLRKAAEAGHSAAMVEYGYALGLGAGLPADPKLALIWLQKAERLGGKQAGELITLFTAMTEE